MTGKAIEEGLETTKHETGAGRDFQHVRNDKARCRDIERAKGLWT